MLLLQASLETLAVDFAADFGQVHGLTHLMLSIFNVVGGNPVSFADAMGLAVYITCHVAAAPVGRYFPLRTGPAYHMSNLYSADCREAPGLPSSRFPVSSVCPLASSSPARLHSHLAQTRSAWAKKPPRWTAGGERPQDEPRGKTMGGAPYPAPAADQNVVRMDSV